MLQQQNELQQAAVPSHFKGGVGGGTPADIRTMGKKVLPAVMLVVWWRFKTVHRSPYPSLASLTRTDGSSASHLKKILLSHEKYCGTLSSDIEEGE